MAKIGVGYWRPNILRNLISSKRCNVIATVDVCSDRRDFVRSLYPGLQVQTGLDGVFENKDIDAVVLATPEATHFDLAVRALEAGKHILVEKPLARSVDEVEHIGELANEKNLVAMVGHTVLFNSAVRHVKQLIYSGELGNIRYIYCQ